MISKEFDFKAPNTLDEALGLLAEHGLDAKVLAGGMSLVPVMTLGLLQPELIVSLNHIPDLDYIKDEGGMIKIGGLTRHSTISSHPLILEHAPLLAESARYVGDVQIRNRGTIGGSLAHADPAADYLPVSLALNVKLRAQKSGGDRVIEASDFFRGLMMTALEPEELLTEIQIPKLPEGTKTSYQRLHRVEGNFAIVAAAAVVQAGGNGCVALGGVGPAPVVFDVSSHLSSGLDDAMLEAIGEAAYEASNEAYGDLNGDAEYRRAMARVFAKRVVQTALNS